MYSVCSRKDLRGDGTASRSSAAAAPPPPGGPSTEIITGEEDQIFLRRQEFETWALPAMERQTPASPHDEPSIHGAASSRIVEGYRGVDEQQLRPAQTQHMTNGARGITGSASRCEQVVRITKDGFHGRHDGDEDCVSEATCRFSSATPGNASSRPPFVSSSASVRYTYGQQRDNGLERATSNDSPPSHPRVWLCKVHRSPFSVCECCGRPFETGACGSRKSLEVVAAAESAPKTNSSELTPVMLQADPTQAVPVIEQRGRTSVHPSGGTVVASVEATAADTCVAAVTVRPRAVPAPAVTPAVEDAAYGYNEGGEYDVQDYLSGVGNKFSVDAASQSSCGRLAEQQRLPVLQLEDIRGRRRLLRQLLPLARLTPFRGPTHAQQAEAVAGRCGATRFLRREPFGRKASNLVEEEDSAVEEELQKKCLDPPDPSLLPRGVSVSNSKLDGISARSARSPVVYSSSPSCSFSILCPSSSSSSSAPFGSSAPSTLPATAAPLPSGARGSSLKAEGSRAGSRRDRCRSGMSSATGVSSVETEVLTRTGSRICATSACGSRTSSRSFGRKSFSYCCASCLGCTWGWAFQRHPPATWRDYLGELKCGVAVALSQLPATMTCAIVANVPVTSALHGAWITGLITAIFGGSPLSVTTVTSSLAVTLAKVTRTVCDEQTNTCTDEGLELIFPALILAGACCLLLGMLRLSRFSQFVPSATIVGYLNAVAIFNVKAQIVTLKFDPVTSTGYEWLWVLLMISTVFAIMCVWEKIPKIRINALVPASVLALAVSSFIEFVIVRRVCGMQTKTVAALSSLGSKDEVENTGSHVQANNSSLWPKPFFLTPENVQPFSSYFRLQDMLKILELTLALVMVNYMSTLITVDMLTDKSSHLHVDSKPDQHLISIGFANVVACFLGALPGSTAPSPSLLNLKLSSKGREGAVIGALINLAFVAASPYFLDLVPLGGLAGIIMYTAYHAFQWRTVAAVFASFLPERLRMKHPLLQRKICRSDAFVMLLTTSIALCADIGTAILSGVCIASCVFAWKNGVRLQVVSRLDVEAGVKFYRVKGPIFFLTKRKLLRYFDVEKDPVSVILELSDEAEQLFDYGALETLDALVTRYRRANKRLKVVGMQCGDRKMIVKAGRLFEFAQIELVEKPLDDSGNVKTIAEMMKLPC